MPMIEPTDHSMIRPPKTRELGQESHPQILTRASVLPGINELDAGDVIECYALMRPAPLDNSFPGPITSSQPIEVRKSAIAFRYKPKSSTPDATTKHPFELTLEYGPQRTGKNLSLEGMPHIHGLDDNASESIYVNWNNHGEFEHYRIQYSAAHYHVFNVTILISLFAVKQTYIIPSRLRVKSGIMHTIWPQLLVLS